MKIVKNHIVLNLHCQITSTSVCDTNWVASEGFYTAKSKKSRKIARTTTWELLDMRKTKVLYFLLMPSLNVLLPFVVRVL